MIVLTFSTLTLWRETQSAVLGSAAASPRSPVGFWNALPFAPLIDLLTFAPNVL